MPTTWSLQVSPPPSPTYPCHRSASTRPPSAAFGCSFSLCYTCCEWATINKIAVSQFWTAVVVTHGLTAARRASDTHRLLYLTHRDEFEREKERRSTLTGLRAAHSLTPSDLLIPFFFSPFPRPGVKHIHSPGALAFCMAYAWLGELIPHTLVTQSGLDPCVLSFLWALPLCHSCSCFSLYLCVVCCLCCGFIFSWLLPSSPTPLLLVPPLFKTF